MAHLLFAKERHVELFQIFGRNGGGLDGSLDFTMLMKGDQAFDFRQFQLAIFDADRPLLIVGSVRLPHGFFGFQFGMTATAGIIIAKRPLQISLSVG